jgi:hypothetical protein
MIASPHFAQMRPVIWLTSSRFASEARAVFESSPFLGIDSRPLSPIFCPSDYLSGCLLSNGYAISGIFMFRWIEVYHREFLLSIVENNFETRIIPACISFEMFRNVFCSVFGTLESYTFIECEWKLTPFY